jgi:hypothetical protein
VPNWHTVGAPDQYRCPARPSMEDWHLRDRPFRSLDLSSDRTLCGCDRRNGAELLDCLQVVRELPESLLTLAHKGDKAYRESFDLVHRHEAQKPNAKPGPPPQLWHASAFTGQQPSFSVKWPGRRRIGLTHVRKPAVWHKTSIAMLGFHFSRLDPGIGQVIACFSNMGRFR